MRVLTVLLLLLGVALAGCSDAPAEQTNDVTLGDGSTVDLDKAAKAENGKGAIAGVVVDESIAPIAGAVVEIAQLALTIETGEDGSFGASDLEPGLYTLSVSAVDYLPIQTTVDVSPDNVGKVRVVLPLDPTPKPYHNTLKFEWYDSAGQPLVDFAWDLFRPGGVPAMCDQCEWTFSSDGPVESFIIEATWEDSVPPAHKASEFYWTMEPTADTSDYESDYFENPGRAEILGNRWRDHTEFFLMLAYEEEWVAVQQSAEVFITMFYEAPAPEGWSIVAGDT